VGAGILGDRVQVSPAIVGEFGQVAPQCGQTPGHRMNVRVDEPGQQACTAQVVNLRSRSEEIGVDADTDRGDTPARDRYRIGECCR